MPPEVTPDMVRQAADRIRPLAQWTPVLSSQTFDAAAGVRAQFKCENFQKGGAFKIRGASNLVFSLSREEIARGVIAYSSGNHAQATAIAAKHAGAACTIVMPADAPRSKLEATRAQGASVTTYDRRVESREAVTAGIMERTGAVLIPPFDHPLIIAGQGTAALEFLHDYPVMDALIAPVGGGGLLSGCAIAARSVHPKIRIFGAEPAEANDTYLSFRKGERVEIARQNTIADGLRSPAPGKITFPILQKVAEDILLVTEEEIRSTLKFLLTRLKILVEPSGAVAAAAVLHHRLPADVKWVGVILSGGNIDFDQLATL
ncbi:MAG: threonine/serine dehydratase [Candidatus Solibacter usitatus]|nr:threonine/serine dehydratase [Candidatus Solibacter usitatus]